MLLLLRKCCRRYVHNTHSPSLSLYPKYGRPYYLQKLGTVGWLPGNTCHIASSCTGLHLMALSQLMPHAHRMVTTGLWSTNWRHSEACVDIPSTKLNSHRAPGHSAPWWIVLSNRLCSSVLLKTQVSDAIEGMSQLFVNYGAAAWVTLHPKYIDQNSVSDMM